MKWTDTPRCRSRGALRVLATAATVLAVLAAGCRRSRTVADEAPTPAPTAAAGNAPATGDERPPAVASGQRLTVATVDRCLQLGRQYLLSAQQPEGRFRYSQHLVTGELAPEDGQVRQAGALWGVALLHRWQPAPELEAAAERGIRLFFRDARTVDDPPRLLPIYPGADRGATGSLALLGLAIVELLATNPRAELRDDLDARLSDIMRQLETLRRPDGRYWREYTATSGESWGSPSPYFDGETLLLLAKAARQQPAYARLAPQAVQSAAAMHAAYVDEALAADPDSDLTKGYFQWGSMAYRELYHANWPGVDGDQLAERTIALSHWMIDVHRTLERRRNTGYAYEGLLSALDLARVRGDQEAAGKFARVAHLGLRKLCSWQVGSPLENDYLQAAAYPRQMVGAVLNGAEDPWLRIDVTQHQMHALLLARTVLLNEPSPGP